MDPLKLRIEQRLARAHLVLWEAAQLAESMRDQGLADDLHQITAEVGRVNCELLAPRAARSKVA